MSGELAVREARPDEYERVAELTVAAYRALGDPREDDYEDELRAVAERAAELAILVALDGERVVGAVSYVPGPGSRWAETEREGEAGLRMLAVDPAAQGRGAGRRLVQACIDRARAERRRALVLMTRPSMTTAQAMYAAMGFRRTPERDWEFEPGEWLWGYGLDLDGAGG